MVVLAVATPLLPFRSFLAEHEPEEDGGAAINGLGSRFLSLVFHERIYVGCCVLVRQLGVFYRFLEWEWMGMDGDLGYLIV